MLLQVAQMLRGLEFTPKCVLTLTLQKIALVKFKMPQIQYIQEYLLKAVKEQMIYTKTALLA